MQSATSIHEPPKSMILTFLKSFFAPHSVEKRRSEINNLLEVVYKDGKYMLDSYRANYSFGGLHLVMRDLFSRFKVKTRKIESVLVLGFGSGSVASIIEKEYKKKIKIVGVEKDPVVVELAKKYFHLEQYKNLELYIEDAFEYIQNCKDVFDMIVMDVFVDLQVPDKFSEEAFVVSLGKCLSVNGILFFNLVVYDEVTRSKGSQLYNQMNSILGNIEWIRMADGRTENWVFVNDRAKNPK